MRFRCTYFVKIFKWFLLIRASQIKFSLQAYKTSLYESNHANLNLKLLLDIIQQIILNYYKTFRKDSCNFLIFFLATYKKGTSLTFSMWLKILWVCWFSSFQFCITSKACGKITHLLLSAFLNHLKPYHFTIRE